MKVKTTRLDGCKPSRVSGMWGNVIRNVAGAKRIVDLEPGGQNGQFSKEGELTGMGCATGGDDCHDSGGAWHGAYFAKDARGGTYTHVGESIGFETGTRALEKLSRTPSYVLYS